MFHKILVPSVTILVILLVGYFLSIKVNAITLGNENADKDFVVDEAIEDDLYVSADTSLTIDQDIMGDVFAAGGEVNINGNIGGDAYIAGGIIVIDGDIDGNVMVFGGQITINGKVSGNVMGAGGTINLNGDFARDVMVAGGQIDIDANIVDDIRAAGGMIDLKGTIGSDALLGAGEVDIQSNIGNDLSIGIGSGKLSSDLIGGDLNIYQDANSNIDIDTKTKVVGERTTHNITTNIANNGQNDHFKNFTLVFIWNLIQGVGLIILGLVVSRIAPVKLDSAVSKFDGMKGNLLNLLIAFIVMFVGVFMFVILLVSVIGWPLLGFVLSGIFIIKLLAVPVVGIALGKYVFKFFKEDAGVFMSLLVGVIIIQTFRSFPFIGDAVGVIVFMLGLGAMLRMWYEKYNISRKY